MIRPSTYRKTSGYTVSVRDPQGRLTRIFAKTREGARLIENAAKRGDSAMVDAILRAGR